MDAATAKQQIVERIKQATNILVTVSTDPSVDQLAACIGLTLLFNRMEKHATAVFSGKVPSTIEFLQPEKTIETNTDSLRDFIISLDKNKADKLRYKVEDDVVRIFITPYRTSITEKDLQFSQGDFNVEVVVALGIQDKSQVDAAITAHGRILHDATVISMNAGDGQAPDLGQINWQEPSASSLSEMLVNISEAFGPNLIDNQMATSFLTGIVSETERFSNQKTTPKVMTIAAQLMAAGANQQLIVSKLEPPEATPPKPPEPKEPPPPPKDGPKPKPAQPLDGTLEVSHEKEKKDSPEVDVPPAEIHIDEQGNLTTTEEMLQKAKEKLEEERASGAAAFTSPVPKKVPVPPGPHSLLDPKTYQPSLDTPFTANTEPEWSDPYNTVPIDPLADGKGSSSTGLMESAKKPEPAASDTSSDSDKQDAPSPDVSLDAARKAVENAPDSALLTPVQSLNAQNVDLDHGSAADSGVNLSSAPASAPPPIAPPLITTNTSS